MDRSIDQRKEENELRSMKKKIKLQQGEEEQWTLFLPQEMIDEILKRLPVKSLVRFSCVCKKWYCLIFADTKFNRAHIGHAAKRLLLLVTTSVEDDDDDEVLLSTIKCCSEQELSGDRYTPNIPGIGKPEILGQCNGLFLVGDSSTRNSYTTAPTISKLFLWNPYINSIKLLNTPPEDIWPMHQLIFGLGYDHTRDDYKAIVFFQFQPNGEPQQLPYVMSLRTNSWTYLNSDDDDDELLTHHHHHSLELMFQDKIATTISGIPHWGAAYGKIWKIICFDTIADKFGEVPLPHNNDMIKELRLGAVQGLLCAVIDRQRAGDQVFEVWTMKEYKISWTKLYTFMHPNNFSRQVVPLGYSSEQGEEELIFVNDNGYWMFNIRDSTGTGRTITDSDPIIRTSLKGGNLLYTPSLFFPWFKEL